MPHLDAIKRACDIVGGQSALARMLATPDKKLSPQSVQYWCRKGLPADWVLKVEAATDGQVSRHELRPDLYPAEIVSH